jgi:putative ABC transport system permease protein
MKLLDLLGLSIKNLWRHKVRTFLTVMGVMIGAGAIVVMISLGLAMSRNFETQASQMGSLTIIQIMNWNQGGKTADGKDIPVLDDAMIAKISRMQGVEMATPLMDLQLKAMAGKYTSYFYVMGIKPEALEHLGLTLAEGAFFTDKDTNVMLANQNLAQQFYVSNPRRWEPAPADFNLMKEKVTVSVDMLYGEKLQSGQVPAKVPAKPVKMHVSGSLGISGSQYDYSIFMPLEQVKKLKADQDKFNKANGLSNGGGGMVYSKFSAVGGSTVAKGYTQAVVKVKDMNAVSKVFEDIKALGYEAYSPIQMIDEMKKQSAGLRQILGGIGAMALLIAAIGITNTMYMSIYERTREIGIIKVIGARLADIRRLFMVEAAWIGIFGGITGVLFSWSASFFLNNSNINIMGGNQMWGPDGVTRLPISYIPLWLMAAAFGFAIAAALIAGFFPARRAMRLSVMKALQQD